MKFALSEFEHTSIGLRKMVMKIDKSCNSSDVVVSGISGVFPNSENVEEFKENLLAGIDMISERDRWNSSTKTGLLKTIDRFDHSFFQITRSQAASSLPISSRLLLEKTFEAIVDAGYNPNQLKGKNIAVICGVWESCDEGDPIWNTNDEGSGAIWNMIHSIKANKISYWLDINGPSFAVNTACSSSVYAMDLAVKLIRNGECEAAIVCTSNLCISSSKFFTNSPVLSQNGNTSAFTVDVSGYTRAEAVVVTFLQKRKDARRVYANIVHTKTNCDGFKAEGPACPSLIHQKQLFEQFYEEIKLDPSMVSYVETHGTATPVGDFVEGTSIEEFFCPGRKTPLKIGSVKSNMGHAEASSGLCSLVKMIVSFETGIIPPNIGYTNPNPEIKGLHNGHLEVVTKPTPLTGKYFAVNNFGLGGANAHMLLTPHDKCKKFEKFENYGIPLLVAVSGRTEEAVDYLLDHVVKNSNDPEYVRLLHEIFSEDISGHSQRGYIILDAGKEVKRAKKFNSGKKRPIWFVFAGMGSQWPTMGTSLMKISIFAESIHKSHETLQSKGIDLIKIITEDDQRMFQNIMNSIVGIAAIQIALLDVLTALEIEPDGIIGHSLGESGCAYADGCLTAEQTILAAYYRGLVSLETDTIIGGKMASIGNSYEAMKDQVPAEIDIACHNGPTNCTISGPAQAMDDYIAELKQKNIFVRKVDTGNIAFHSRYIAPAVPKFNSYLKEVIPKPKLRSKKWICSSALAKDWNTDSVRYSSAEYHTNNLLNPVYFEESCKYIPDDAILIEIAPHGLLNAILKRSLPQTVVNIPLTLRNHRNQVEYFLNALGQLYEAGCVPKINNLYPHVEFPVSKSTPMISPLIKWQHNEQWPVGRLDSEAVTSCSRNVLINPQSADFKFLYDHSINGISVYPASGYLVMVWETLAIMFKKKKTQIAIVFENVTFEQMTRIPEKGTIKFEVTIFAPSNNFEVTENGVIVAKGIVRLAKNIEKETITSVTYGNQSPNNSITMLSGEDFYKEMGLRKYSYKKTFKTVSSVNSNGMYGKVSWNDNFITFIDAMLQISVFNIDTRELLIPTFIRKIVINAKQHIDMLKTLDATKPEFVVHFHPNINLLSAGGIQIVGSKTMETIQRQHQGNPVLEKYQFLPYINDERMNFDLAVRMCIHIAIENIATIKIKTIEILDSGTTADIFAATRMSAITLNTLRDMPYIQASVNILMESEPSPQEMKPLRDIGLEFIEKLPENNNYSIIFMSEIGKHIKVLPKIFDTIRKDGFLITKESIFENSSIIERLGFVVCFSRTINSDDKILLLRKATENSTKITSIEIKNDAYSWVVQLQSALKTLTHENNEILVLYSEKNPLSGILGLFNCIRKEEKGMLTRCFFLVDENAGKFSMKNVFYKKQYNKNLAHNVYKDGQWGSYRHLQLEPTESIKTTDAVCELEAPGDFSSIRWIENSLETDINLEGRFLARVYYCGLNFKDIMVGSRKLSNLDSFHYSRLLPMRPGYEFSGQDETGYRVMGIVPHGGMATVVKTIPHLTWKVPQNMTLEEAASIPIAYMTVIYAFFSQMHLKRRCSVLIHAGSGGVGQAAINICLYYECNIFTSVGSADKVNFIRKMYPQIPAMHICNSRDTSFETIIMQETNGRGVDVVLNCLSGDEMQASVRCVARGGHFLEIGKSKTQLGCFHNEVTLHSVQLDYVICTANEETLDVSKKFQKMLDQGVIKPIKRVVFQMDEIETAFRFMASAKHIGKIVIKLQEEKVLGIQPNSCQVNAKPFVNCHKNRSYVIIGGLGGFGLELADWLIMRGARNLLLSSRSGIKNGYQAYRINLWRSYGVKIVISTESIVEKTGARRILQEAAALGPISGIFNLAMILDDKPFSEQNEDSFRLSVHPKAIATAHFDQLSRTLCAELEYFVVFSSVICGRGNPESTNYAFANSIMERICEKRKADNLPALAIQWGAIGDVGVVAKFSKNDESLIIGGVSQQNIESCLKTLNVFMKQPIAIVSSIIVATKHHVETNVIDVVANILGITDTSTINQTWTLPELGMDSIIAMELRQILEAEFNSFFTPGDVRKLTFAKLHKLKEDKTILRSGSDQLKITNGSIFHSPLTNMKIKEKNSLVGGTPTMFIFPGVEGIAKEMDQLTKNLPMPVQCFQYLNIESASSFLTTLQNEFVKVILNNLHPDQEFHIIGYSLGGLLAIEVVCSLEEKGRKGHVWLIDSSPAYLFKKATEFAEKQDNPKSESLQKGFNVRGKNLIQKLGKEGTNLLRNEIINYKFSHALLESTCTLIKSADCHFDLDDSFGLTEIFKNPVQVHQINETDHYTVLSDPRTVKIIMEFPI